MSNERNDTIAERLVLTKHGFKARRVTQTQEATMDKIAADPFEDPIARVTVLNDRFHTQIIVYQTDGEQDRASWIITQDGESYRL